MAWGFSFGGVRADTKGINVTDVRRNIMPPIDSRILTMPGMAGAYYYNSQFRERMIEVDIYLKGTSLENDRTLIRAMAEYLDPSVGLQALIFDDETTIKWNAVLTADTDLENIVLLRRGTLRFLVPEAFAQSTSLTYFTYTGSFTRVGTAPAYPIITCTRTGSTATFITVTHTQTGNHITINNTINTSDVIVFDHGLRYCTLNGSSIMTKVSYASHFTSLVKGSNSFTITSGFSTTVSYYGRYL